MMTIEITDSMKKLAYDEDEKRIISNTIHTQFILRKICILWEMGKWTI